MSTTRRKFLIGAGCVAGVAAGGAVARTLTDRAGAVMPPGAGTLARFKWTCTACGLCMSSCPEKVLAPAGFLEYGLTGARLPKLDFSRGACDPTCTRCAEVCPAQAFRRFSPEERVRVQIGIAEWLRENCRTTKGDTCTLCSERCPCKAIALVADAEGAVAHPKVDAAMCIGCGKCENYCPAETKAIRVRPLDPQGFATSSVVLSAGEGGAEQPAAEEGESAPSAAEGEESAGEGEPSV